MSNIHPTAIVSSKAKLGDAVRIGPYVVIDDDVEIGSGSHIMNGAAIYSGTKLGDNCRIYPYVVLGLEPQHVGYKGEEPSRLEIGNGCVIREFSSLRRGFPALGGITRLDDNVYILTTVHLAHDCKIGEGTIIGHGSSFGGGVVVGRFCNFNGHTRIQQHRRVGDEVFAAFLPVITKDLPPFTYAALDRPFKHNAEGMRRHNHSEDEIGLVKRMYRTIYSKNLTLKDAISELKNDYPQEEAVVQNMIDFLSTTKIGIMRPYLRDS